MILSRFQWYRRMRGGYWAQVSAPLDIGLLTLGFLNRRWVRCKESQPTPDQQWTFYPWAQKTMGNGYIDEWHSVEPCWAVPFSSWVAETIGTNDMALVLGLIRQAREAQFIMWTYGDTKTKQAALELRLALIPFEKAKHISAGG